MTFTKSFRAALVAAPLALAFASGAHAQTSLAFFNFNDALDGTGAFAQTAAFAADGGVFQATTNITTNFDTTAITAFSGTTTNNTPPGGAAAVAGSALAIQGGTNQVNDGRFFQFNTSTVGFNAINLSLAVQRTGTGFNSNVLSYSTNGTTFTNFATFTPVASFTTPAGSGLQTFDLSGVTALNNAATVTLRLTLSGVTSSAGNNRFDNVQINGTAIGGGGGGAVAPEPASLLLLGMGVIGIVARRRRK